MPNFLQYILQDAANEDGAAGGSLLDAGLNTDPANNAGDTTGSGATDSNDTTGSGQSWLDQFPDSYKADPNLTKYNSLEAFLDGHQNLAKAVGAKSLSQPGEDANEDAWNEYYTKLGRPEDIAGYEYAMPTIDTPEGAVPVMDIESDEYKNIANALHGAGLTKPQFQKTMDVLAGNIKNDIISTEQTIKNDYEAANQTLRAEWGNDFRSNLTKAAQAADKLGLRADIDQLGLANNPQMLNALVKMAGVISEGSGEGTFNQPGPGNIQSAIDSIESSEAFKMGERNPNFTTLNRERLELYKKLNNRG